ncbi:hydrolase [Devosia pacifica]|uniref:Hydrolase n=1 Tax=Devosia pacifica TaxID=1335967 RepID=A0A918SCD2_9HYPH|nr:alpha/beta family hydrolase [Devosia pacifica]GHA35473.1 hydrolase [Devosia pacifica]
MSTDFLFDGPEAARITLLLAHGAGAGMDSASMAAAAQSIAGHDIRVARFEFGYMAARRTDGQRKPPPKAEKLQSEYVLAIENLGPTNGPLLIGGKSMGGRVASMIADEALSAGRIAGLVCLGYPFHPPGKPEQLRTAHLEEMQTPALICQGTRDIFGSHEEVVGYTLSSSIEISWFEDGDHDLKPRKSVSGFTAADHMRRLGETVADWSRRLGA